MKILFGNYLRISTDCKVAVESFNSMGLLLYTDLDIDTEGNL